MNDHRRHIQFDALTALALGALLLSACDAVQEDIYRGASLANVGDWDGDGADDFAVGEFHLGRVTVLSGRTGSELCALDGGADFGWSLCGLTREGEASRLLAVGSPKAGRVQFFEPLASSPHKSFTFEKGAFGWSLVGCGDVDGDGLEDVLVAVPEFEENGDAKSRCARLYSTGTGEVLAQSNESESSNLMGFSVAALQAAGDDRAPDLLVGRGWVPEVNQYAGDDGALVRKFAKQFGGVPHSYPIVVIGGEAQTNSVAISNPATSDGGTVFVFNASAVEKFRIAGSYKGDRFGHSITVDGAESSALLIGAPGRIKSAGVSLKPVALRDETPEGAKPGFVRLHSAENGDELWRFTRDEVGDWLGIASCSIGDLDGDGAGDFAVAGQAPGSSQTFVTVLSGRSGAPIYEQVLASEKNR